jgi:hypothetical protein
LIAEASDFQSIRKHSAEIQHNSLLCFVWIFWEVWAAQFCLASWGLEGTACPGSKGILAALMAFWRTCWQCAKGHKNPLHVQVGYVDLTRLHLSKAKALRRHDIVGLWLIMTHMIIWWQPSAAA